MILKHTLWVSLLSLCTPSAWAQNLSENLGQMPYKHARKCDTILDTRGFNVLTNKNCDVLFLAPPPVEKPVNDIELHANVDMCTTVSANLETLNILASLVTLTSKQLNVAIEKQNEKQINVLSKQLKDAQTRLLEQQSVYEKTASLPGATVTSSFTNDVDGNDLYNFYAQNFYVLKNLKNPPHITTIQPENSVFSFSFYRAENASPKLSSIISTAIPGFEVLAQLSSKQSDVAHVKTNDASGKTVLSLMATCPMAEFKDGKWVALKEKLKNIMTVNRTYEIPMKVGYGVEARLNSKVAAGVVADLVANTANHGLSKTQVYNKMLNVSGSEVFTIKIDTEVPLKSEEKDALEHDIRKRLVDRFLLYFEMRGDLANLQPVDVKAPEGGEVPVKYVGTHCWSDSGFFGIGGSSGCRDYIYTVKEWREGKTSAEIHDYLSVDLDISEKKLINDVVMVPMSTTFFDKGE